MIVILFRVSVSVVKEIISDVTMTPDQRNIVENALKNIGQGQEYLDLEDFCTLFQDIDSVCHSLLPRRSSKFLC